MLFTIKSREALRRAYHKAVAEGTAEFTYQGNQFDTSYAGYLLKYLDTALKSDHSIVQSKVQS
jgi:hypothetical protein